jgi:hypothetical protein
MQVSHVRGSNAPGINQVQQQFLYDRINNMREKTLARINRLDSELYFDDKRMQMFF